MLGKPPETPVTTPEADPTVANAGLLLVHVPGPVGSVSVTVEPGQTLVKPLIAAADELTVI